MQFNRIQWRVFQLGERAILFEAMAQVRIEEIHHCSKLMEQLMGLELEDIVPASQSITIFTEKSIDQVQDILENTIDHTLLPDQKIQKEILRIPICYAFGEDLERIAEINGLKYKEVIEKHLQGCYTVAFIGFTPGFIYANGLNQSIACPRLDIPRKAVPKGTVGIGGNQTGIYSLASPGGWNIVGRTPMNLFEKSKKPPLQLNPGDRYQFYQISKEAFDLWGK